MKAFCTTPLRTRRILLRPMHLADAEAIFGIFSDPEATRYLSRPAWTSLDQAHERIGKDLAGMASGEYLRLGLELLDSAELIGECCLFSFNEGSRRAEIGYALARKHWGRGYMGEALPGLLNIAFVQLRINRLEADIDPRNEASARTLQRLGFAKEGYLRERWIVNGEPSDSALYGLTATDWASRAPPGATA